MKHRLSIVLAAFAVVVTPAYLGAAELPWVGKWKVNAAKSDFAQQTVTYAAAGPGETQWTADGMTGKFKMDGKDYPDPDGTTEAWKQIDASTWETVFKLNGKVTSTDTTRLSADGNTLTIKSVGTKPNGQKFEDESSMTRVSGGPGLNGKWKTAKVSIGAPNLIEITPFEGDGLTGRNVDYQSGWSGKFDGKDIPVTGPQSRPGVTVTMQRTGPNSYDFTTKQNGKETYKGSSTVSADGKTLTIVSVPTGTTEKRTVVYDRQ
jgi:hypothetical protein